MSRTIQKFILLLLSLLFSYSVLIANVVITDITVIDEVCMDETGGLTISATTDSTGDLRYSIDGGLSFQLDSVFLNLAPGDYQIVVADDNSCTETTTVTIELLVTANSNSLIQIELCPGEVFEFNGIEYTEAGTFTDTLISSLGCDSILTIEINAFNCTGSTSVNDLTTTVINLRPNPTSDYVFIEANSAISAIKLIDISGTTRITQLLPKTSPEVQIDLVGTEAGLYLIEVETATGRAIQKLIIE